MKSISTYHFTFLWMMAVISFIGCKTPQNSNTLFTLLSAAESNIAFENTIQESDSFNMYTFMNIYTGGGVAVGDIDNDGLEDIFFSGNRVTSRLYKNLGNLAFEDITDQAGIETNRWCSGVSMVDINMDGHLDIYVSVTGVGSTEQKSNLLYINNGDATFQESANEYGLADPAQIMHSSFFDFDKDGDLDVYMIVNPVDYAMSNVNSIHPRKVNGEAASTDKLYRNDNGQFVDVSRESGILIEGYSLGVSTADINGDGWPDIYVSNDFLTNDILYINNQDGTFSDQLNDYFDCTSFAGMGHDVSDVNNDGHMDVMVVDMLPEDHFRRQMIIPASSYDKYQFTQKMGYTPQFTRNTLQLNNGDGSFSEIGQLAGIDQTDWSWSTLFADYDNDGDKDLLVTNGFLRDVGNLDYISYQQKNNASPFGKQEIHRSNRLKAIEDLGAAKIPNYIYENVNGIQFKKRSKEWGLHNNTCSNGAAFSDLDKDGDLDLIISNVNDRAFIYRNNTNEINNFISIQLIGHNHSIGAKIEIVTQSGGQTQSQHLYRGYGSTVTNRVHFGIGSDSVINIMTITWPEGETSIINNISCNQLLTIDKNKIQTEIQSNTEVISDSNKMIDNKFFDAVNAPPVTFNESLNHTQNADFKIQPLLTKSHSENKKLLDVGDMNDDDLDDIIVANSRNTRELQLWLASSKSKSKIKQVPLKFPVSINDIHLVDVNSDGLDDIYLACGDYQLSETIETTEDQLLLNMGAGNFGSIELSTEIKNNHSSIVRSCDYDHDGDMDLFIGGSVRPGEYPIADDCFILRNNFDQKIKGDNVDFELEKKKSFSGLIKDAAWVDMNKDGWEDLIIVGEWMAPTIFYNQKGEIDFGEPVAVPNAMGWWRSIKVADLDGDGDMDFLAGNEGLNTRLKASVDEPLKMYAKDFDNNGRIDPVLSHWIEGKEHVFHPRDQLVSQINAMRARFKNYESYARAELHHTFTEEELSEADVFIVERFTSTYFKNVGNGKFELIDLPIEAQFAPINDFYLEDFNGDGLMDIVLVGNDASNEVAFGPQMAMKGLVLINRKNDEWKVMNASDSGFKMDGVVNKIKSININGEDMVLMPTSDGQVQWLKRTNVSL